MGSLLVMGVMMGVMGAVGLGSLWKSRRAPAEAPAFAISPVDGRRLEVTPATPRAVVGGKTFFFEDEEQQRAFVLEPVVVPESKGGRK
ncbi:MAG: hypothetical protein HYV14_04840 [Elusimicrobia bacterium]|nr:hypothetical protein [Elusimicrobiota bacterium]